MANHQHVVAKAAFAASMLRPDPAAPSPGSHDLTQFHTLLGALTSKCSSENVQLCKMWLLKHMTSPMRVEALGKYLTFLSNSFADLEDEKARKRSSASGSSNKRKRLHLLFLVNDLLHHTKFHERDPTASNIVTSKLQPYIEGLVKLAASYDAAKNPKFHQEIADLLDLWKENKYYDVPYLDSLQNVAKRAPSESTLDIGKAINADAPFMMPARHGRPNAPYHDLPAGNMIPHIIPNRATPIGIRQMKPLQFKPGPADDRLAKTVKDFLKDVDDIYRPILHDDEGIVADIDKMGQAMTKDEDTGELTVKYGYYGCISQGIHKITPVPTRNGSKGLNLRNGSMDSPDSSSAVILAVSGLVAKAWGTEAVADGGDEPSTKLILRTVCWQPMG
ncbi:hypothetical protein K490DRAFT_62059 [Saccharata proteae CBS 121410]|uniref:CID domain-containing protein n=1 Tax=Saccharata proteae CBS 121410 TaxID=1314787 RepID=A0A9P4I1Z9_9PEZI|nr:hypothetical protein K490DRAFT_62059 [Saccharata proteae CBS 121410]